MKYSITIASDNANELAAFLKSIDGGPVSVVTGTDSEDDDNAPPATIQPGEVDVTGLVWDERIHAGTKTKTAAGNWKKRKGTDDATIAAVEGELRGRAAAVASAQTAPGVVPPVTPPPPVAPPAPVVAAPPHDPIAAAVADGWIAHPSSPGYYYKGQEVLTTDATAAKYPAPAPSAPATPPAAPATGPKTFHDLMQAISAGVAANKIDTDGVYVGQLAAALGVGVITEIAASPDKIAQAFAQMAADGKLQ